MNLDSITLSVIQAGLQQVCDEMDLSFSRAAFSPVIAEANDRSDGIYAAADVYFSTVGDAHVEATDTIPVAPFGIAPVAGVVGRLAHGWT